MLHNIDHKISVLPDLFFKIVERLFLSHKSGKTFIRTFFSQE